MDSGCIYRSGFYLFLAFLEILAAFGLAWVFKACGMPFGEALILVPGIPAVVGTITLMTKTEYNY